MRPVTRTIETAELAAKQEAAAIRESFAALLDRAEAFKDDCSRLTSMKKEGEHIAWALKLAKDQLAQESPPVRLRMEA